MLAPPPLSLPSIEPPLWARGGHAQTLFGVWLPTDAAELIPGERGVERFDVTLDDGDRLVTLEAAPRGGREERPAEAPWVVHLFHGLTGSTDSGYVRRATARFRAAGHTVIAVNHRGAGLGAGLARGMYHSGVAHDVRAAIAAGRARHPRQRHLAIGYSLSGNALLLAIGRDRARSGELPDAGIAVNPPVDLAGCVGRLERPSNRLYDVNFVRGCARAIDERVRAGLLSPQPKFGLRATIRDFDERVTAPLAGFRDAADYYARCSARPWLTSIEVPTVILTSLDDPLIDWRDAAEAQRSPAVDVHVAAHGGHMGYLARERAHSGSRRWLEEALEVSFAHLARRVLEGEDALAGALT
ncbi:MAG: hypothetical protein R3F49_06725 [Planctomycetota bacterium]